MAMTPAKLRDAVWEKESEAILTNEAKKTYAYERDEAEEVVSD